MCWLELNKELQFKSSYCLIQWNGISLPLTRTFVLSVGMVAPNQHAVNQYRWVCVERTEVTWKVRQNADPCASCFSSWVLLIFQDFGEASGHVDTRQPLRFRQHGHLFFFQLQVSYQEVQLHTPLRGISAAAKFTGIAPAGWPFKAIQNRVLQLDHWLWIYMPGICYFRAANNSRSAAPWLCLVSLRSKSHWPAGSFHEAACSNSSTLPPSECWKQRNVLK